MMRSQTLPDYMVSRVAWYCGLFTKSGSIAMLAAMSWASGLVATPPLFLCCLPCRVTGIADRLLFSLQQRFSFCLFGRFARCLIGGRPRGVGCCLRSNLGLLCKFPLL